MRSQADSLHQQAKCCLYSHVCSVFCKPAVGCPAENCIGSLASSQLQLPGLQHMHTVQESEEQLPSPCLKFEAL